MSVYLYSYMLVRKLLYLLLLTEPSAASWFFKEQNICNSIPDSGPLTFTGFKIMRQYKIEGVMPTSMHFITIYHCSHGKVDYSKSIRVKSSNDIDWDDPFCLIKPNLGTKLNDLPEDTVKNLDPIELEFNEEQINEINKLKGRKGGIKIDALSEVKAQTEAKVRENIGPVKTLMKKTIDKTLQSITKDTKVKYIGRYETDHLTDIQESSIQSSIEWESRNLVCYKMARRRKYAKRKITYYMPYTFVGGLFECKISDDARKEIFQSFSSGDFSSEGNFKSFQFRCDKSLAIPIKPLIAEDSTKQFFKRISSSMIQSIPYLTTATPLDLRFRTSDTHDMYSNTWAKDIDVNEDYNYNEFEINLILKGMATSSNFLNKMLSLKPTFKFSKYNSLRKHEKENEEKTNDLYRKFDNFTIDQKISTILSTITDSDESYKLLHHLQKLWDDVLP